MSGWPETVGLLLDPAHAAEITIESEDAAYRLGLGRVDDERALVGVIAQRDIATHPHALFLRCGDLVARMRSPVTSRSNCAKDNSTLSVRRPIEVVVLNCCVTETNDAPLVSRISTILAKLASERVSRSIL